MKSIKKARSVQNFALYLIGLWREVTRNAGPADYLQSREFQLCVDCVKENITKTRDLAPLSNLWQRSPMFGAFLVYFWPIYYQHAVALFQKLNKPLGRVLDLCAGPGPFTLAALESGASEVVSLDSSERSLMLLSEFVAREGYTLSVRPWRFGSSLNKVEGSFDTLILGHSLLDQTKGDVKFAFASIQSFKNMLSDKGRILIFETSDPQRIKLMKQIADLLAPVSGQSQLKEVTVSLERTRLIADIMKRLKRFEIKNRLQLLNIEK